MLNRGCVGFGRWQSWERQFASNSFLFTPHIRSHNISAYPPACPLLYTIRAHSIPYLAIQYHARRGAAPPAYQYYHTGPCSWRYALALPVLQYLLL